MNVDQTTLRQTSDKLTSLLKLHDFSDTSLDVLVSAFINDALGLDNWFEDHDAEREFIEARIQSVAIICGHLKSNIRWHATAQRSAAFQMTLSTHVNKELYHGSKYMFLSLSLVTQLFIHTAFPIETVFHSWLHVAQTFNDHSELLAIALEIERCQAKERPLYMNYRILIEKVEGRLKELGMKGRDDIPLRYSLDDPQYRRALDDLEILARRGKLEPNTEELSIRAFDEPRQPRKIPADEVAEAVESLKGWLESLVTCCELDMEKAEKAEKAEIGKSKAGI